MYKNKVNGKIYVGKTGNLEKRVNEHKRMSGSCPLFHKAIKKYGVENFYFTILGEFEQEIDAFSAEKYYIKWFKTNTSRYGNKYGYNLTDGGEGASGFVQSEETRRRKSLSFSGSKNPNFGKQLSEAQKLAISVANTGYKHTEETKQKMSDAHIAEKNYNFGRNMSNEQRLILSEKAKIRLSEPKNNPMYGKKHSAETKQKISNNNKGHASPNKGKKIHSEEVKRGLSEKAKIRFADPRNNIFYGKKHSEESKAKMSVAQKNRSYIANAKLAEQDVIEIKKLLPIKTSREIAVMYGVSYSTIARIRQGKNWDHIKE